MLFFCHLPSPSNRKLLGAKIAAANLFYKIIIFFRKDFPIIIVSTPICTIEYIDRWLIYRIYIDDIYIYVDLFSLTICSVQIYFKSNIFIVGTASF